MSLINEALKKAQSQSRTSDGAAANPPGSSPPQQPHPEQPARPRRSFLWGFLMAILVVGTVTTLLTTFFVRQILGPTKPDESEPDLAQASVESPSPDPAVIAAPPPPPTQSVPATQPVPALPQIPPSAPAASRADPPPDSAISPAAGEPAPEPAVTLDTAEKPVASDPEPEAAPALPDGTPPAPKPPDPAIMARLMEIEIRGMMSGGTKVLVHDKASGKIKAYEAGDTLEGPMGLVVEKIHPDSIQFRDYAGSLHTKSF